MPDLRAGILRVFDGNPYGGGTYRGSAFLIGDRYAATCKHVVRPIDDGSIHLLGDGAWGGGGVRTTRKVEFHPQRDVAVLELAKATDLSVFLPLADPSKTLLNGDELVLAGCTASGRSVETPQVAISGYDGRHDLELTDAAIQKGMSGGPALHNGEVVGITQAREDTHALIIPLEAFFDFLRAFTGGAPKLVLSKEQRAAVPLAGHLSELAEVCRSSKLAGAALARLRKSSLPIGGFSEDKFERIQDPEQVFVRPPCMPATHTNVNALENAADWIEDGLRSWPECPQLLLGKFGYGKSYTIQHVWLELHDRWAQSRDTAPIPVLCPLSKYTWRPGQPDSILEYVYLNGLVDRDGHTPAQCWTQPDFKKLASEGRLAIILDGVDEIRRVRERELWEVLASIGRQHFGGCAWIAAGRSGVFGTVFARKREALLSQYRVGWIWQWGVRQWLRYLVKCRKVGAFDPEAGEMAEGATSVSLQRAFSRTVAKQEHLSALTNTPLFARMLVECWRKIVRIGEDVTEARLYREYSNHVLSDRRLDNVLDKKDDIPVDVRRQCLEAMALYLFRPSLFNRSQGDEPKAFCLPADLRTVANRYNRQVGIRKIEDTVALLQTYSLLTSGPGVELNFSHESFREYFLAEALCRAVREQGGRWRRIELMGSRLLDQVEIDALALNWLGKILNEPENQATRDSLAGLLRGFRPADSDGSLKRNLLGIALGARMSLERADLSRASLVGLDLSKVDLRDANLDRVSANGARFTGANLTGASFRGGVVLQEADLRDAILVDAELPRANLIDADLRGANFKGATLQNARLIQAKLNGANLSETDLRGADLEGAEGLDNGT